MDSKTNVPSFTVSLRGYDRMEVDEYLDSLAEALGQVEDAQEQNRRLQAHIARQNSRIKDLEDRISADTPRTGSILAERIGIMLRQAEDTASDTVERAEARAAELVAEAERRVAEAEDAAGVAVAGGQEQARRIEAAARAEAAEIISEAEARAAARTRQIEQWAEQVVSHTRAEEARMLQEQQAKREAALAELRSLGEQRDTVAATLAELRETLGQALGLVVPPAGTGPDGPAELPAARDEPARAELTAAPEPAEAPAESLPADVSDRADDAAEADGDEDRPGWPPAGSGPALFDGEATGRPAEEPVTDQVELAAIAEAGTKDADDAPQSSDGPDEEFEAKLEAWVSEGARHFRRG